MSSVKILGRTGPTAAPVANPPAPAVGPSIPDRYERLDGITWFRRDAVQRARVLVLGAGALGNETLKNLALFGIGRIAVCDFDRVELSNLSRSLLFTESDIGENKAVAAARSLKRINPHIQIVPLSVNILGDVGTAFFGWFDIVIGAVDTREGRLAINQACWKTNRPFIDGGLDLLSGVVKVFLPPHSSCYECTMAEEDFAQLPRRHSCGLLAKAAEAVGGVPTTPISAAVIGALQAQEALKLLHPEMPGRRLSGQGYLFDGLHFDPMLITFPRKPDDMCSSHSTYEHIHHLPGSRHDTSIGGLLDWAREQGMECDTIVFERNLLLDFACDQCLHIEPVARPEALFRGLPGPCPKCNSEARRVNRSLASLHPKDWPADTILASLGIPPMDIVRLQAGDEERFVTLDGDARELFPQEFLGDKSSK